MIPSLARLPYRKSLALESAFDYINYGSLIICYRYSMLEVPTELASIKLNGIRVGKKGISKMKATMEIGKDLVGEFRMRDSFTQSTVSVMFDGGAAFQALKKSTGLVARKD